MLRRCTVRCSGSQGLREGIEAAMKSAAYLRHAPPLSYYTCSMDQNRDLPRCKTELLDVGSCLHATPHTSGVYVLSSTTEDDLQFENREVIERTMVGVPQVTNKEEFHLFMEQYQSELEGLRCVALPEVSLQSGFVLSALQRHFPELRIACSSFGRFLFSDLTFFSGLKSTFSENYPPAMMEAFTFPQIDPECIVVPQEGEAIPGCSRLRGYLVPPIDTKRSGQPDHFREQLLFYYDEVFHHFHVGGALWRLPWLPSVAPEAGREVVLPMCSVQSRQWSAAGGASLLELWRPDRGAQRVAATLQKEPFTQEVLTTHFGALPGDVDEVATAVEEAGEALEGLRSRLAHRLETDTQRDLQKWSTLLRKRIVDEVLFTQTPTVACPESVREELYEWLHLNSGLGPTAVALARSALSLPPSQPPTPVRSRKTASPEERAAEKEEKIKSQLEKESAELEGKAGVQLMKQLLSKKGLDGLGPTAEKEHIDVRVFLSMNEGDLKKVFKTTFGITKKLQMLQEELKEKMT